MKERVLVFGGKGWLARRIAECLHAVVSDADITQPDEVARALEEHGAEVAVNAAAKTGTPNVDWCDLPENIGPTFLANTVGPVALLTACRRQHVRLVHLSTTYVFEKNAPSEDGFDESVLPDLTHGGQVYGMSKAAADLALSCFPQTLILRINLPIDEQPHARNFITRLAGYRTVQNVRHALTTVPMFLSVLQHLVGREASGVYHVVHQDTVTNGELMHWYRELVDPDHDFALKEPGMKTRPGIVAVPRRLLNEGVLAGLTEPAVRECLQRYAQARKKAEAAS